MNLPLLGTRRTDLLKRTVTDDHGSERLTPHEAELLAYLADANERAVPRQELLENVWGYHASVRSRTVDTTLSRLRGKLEAAPSRPRFLRTVRGAGIQLSGGERPEPLVPPTAPATLVGRDDLVRTIHLPNPGLVTLVGPPGVG